MLLPALAAAKQRAIRTQCLNNVHQIEIAVNSYTVESIDKLPVLTGTAAWAWDLPTPAADLMLKNGMTKKSIFCPGTAPRFTDKENWAGPGTGPDSTLWNFNAAGEFHIVGYALAFTGAASKLDPTNQNTTLQPETVKNTLLGTSMTTSISDRVLIADATISPDGARANPWLPPSGKQLYFHIRRFHAEGCDLSTCQRAFERGTSCRWEYWIQGWSCRLAQI